MTLPDTLHTIRTSAMLVCLGGFAEDAAHSRWLWSDRDKEILRDMRARNIKYKYIAERLGKSESSCIANACRFGYTRGRAIDMVAAKSI